MIKKLVKLFLVAAAVLVSSQLIEGVVLDDLGYALLVAFVLALINVLVRPILFLLTLPLNIITLGLFTFILNALLLWLASLIVIPFVITGFIPALLASLVISLIVHVGEWVLELED